MGQSRRCTAAWVSFRVAFLLLTLVTSACMRETQAERRVRSELRRQLGQGFHLFRRPTVDADDIQPLVLRFYRQRQFRPVWTDGNGPTRDARDLIQALEDAPREGLDGSEYVPDHIDLLMKQMNRGLLGPRPPARELAAFDLKLTRPFLAYAAHVSTGQVDPKALPADWHVRRGRVNVLIPLTDALRTHRIRQTLAGLAPRDPRYARLRDALERHRAIAAAGGWASVPPGPTLRRGSHGSRVAALRSRLAATDHLPPTWLGSTVFDAATEDALRRFQERHGLDPNGVADSRVLEALNVPVEQRIRQIALNMERWRWVPANLGDRYIMVNIPAYTLELNDRGRAEFTTRVVVGKQFSPTPMFSDKISYLVINPYWNVPTSIAGNELLPAIQKDPSYLYRNGFHVFDSAGPDAREIDAASVNWNHVSPEQLTYSFRQEPSFENPVGHVKFMCPNQFDVYLHDTPSGHLFSASDRDFSHGCVRVEHADELAERLLQGVAGSSRKEIDAAFASAARDSVVRLPRPVPVHLMYWTAWVDDQGRVQFRDDVYGLDRVLGQTLGHRGSLDFHRTHSRGGPHEKPGA